MRPTLALPLALQVLSQEPEVPTREVVAVYDMELLMVDAFLGVSVHLMVPQPITECKSLLNQPFLLTVLVSLVYHVGDQKRLLRVPDSDIGNDLLGECTPVLV